MPKSDAPAATASRITAGCRSTERLWMIGWRKFPSRNCTATTRRQGGEPDHPASIRERDQNGDEAGQQRADERYERAEEDQHGEGETPHGTPSSQSPSPISDASTKRDERRSPDEAAQLRPTLAVRRGRSPAGSPVRTAAGPTSHSAAPSRRTK